MWAKRCFDVLVAAAGLLLLLVPGLVVAVLIKLDSPGPVFFRQERVGRHGRHFRIHKFRTMCVDAERLGGSLTVGADARVTRLGARLRGKRIDEMPQLIDVLLGDMSLVGPRPEVPRFVAAYPADLRELILSVRPGITDPGSIEYRDEATLLAGAAEPERVYIEEVLPAKLRFSADHVRERSFWRDLRVIWRTLHAVWG